MFVSTETDTPPDSGLLRQYRPLEGSWDEMMDAKGQIRPAWAELAETLVALGVRQLGERAEELQEQLRVNGVTYHVYGDRRGADRLWSLDPVPMVLASGEWSEVERGLIQRAELLDAVLHDIYGPRHLVRDGLLPALFLYSHPGFQRACCGTTAGLPRLLRFYSADLARRPDGEFQVISDRCQNPSGYGYALENRTVLSRAFPSLFRHFGVHRLPNFFQAFRRALAQAAPVGVQNPFIALLSPGPENETYFEQSYIASYLGLPLVRGGDLIASEAGISVGALDGPRTVDVLLRRVDDAYCDPLELHGGSLLGVPGLLQAVRNRQVTVCNALGSGVLGGSGLMAFLPALCRKILGEELLLPSTPTLWLGDAGQRQNALNRFDEMVIKPVYQGPKRSTWFVQDLTLEQREKLLARIRAKPHLYLAQERIPLSTAPSFAQDRLEPRPMVLRSFVAAADGSYAVMPGGLTRVSSQSKLAEVTGQGGGISKDTWILTSEPVALSETPERHAHALRVNRQSGPLPGHAAENLFWLGRYQERLESQSRIWREALASLSERQNGIAELSVDWMRLLWLYEPGLPAAADAQGLESELLNSLGDAAMTGSPAYNRLALRRAARAIRDLLSNDCWLAINTLTEDDSQAEGESVPVDAGAARSQLDRTILILASFTGLVSESMTVGPVRRFIQLGRRLERAHDTARILGAALGGNSRPSEALLRNLLAFHDSAITYRTRYQNDVQAGAVADLLVADELNARSITYQLARLDEDLAQIPRGNSALVGATEKLVLKALTATRVFESGGPEGIQGRGNEAFEHLMHQVATLLTQASESMVSEFFQHLPSPQPLREWV